MLSGIGLSRKVAFLAFLQLVNSFTHFWLGVIDGVLWNIAPHKLSEVIVFQSKIKSGF